MAATPEARQLTEAHRSAQGRLGAGVVLAMRSVWSLLDVDDLDGSLDRWLGASRLIVSGQRSSSARLAGNYLSTFKRLELGSSARSLPLVLAESEPVEAVVTSLVVTGPAAVKSAIGRGVTPARAMQIGQARSAASAMRHVLGGGRDTIVRTVDADDQAIGWARVVSGSGCAFCAMLASRGPVFKGGTVDFDAHDGCMCGVQAVYRDDAEWPAGSRRYRELWDIAQSDRRADESALNAFRRALTPSE